MPPVNEGISIGNTCQYFGNFKYFLFLDMFKKKLIPNSTTRRILILTSLKTRRDRRAEGPLSKLENLQVMTHFMAHLIFSFIDPNLPDVHWIHSTFNISCHSTDKRKTSCLKHEERKIKLNVTKRLC
jgi:hypothetical protein